MPVTPSPDRWVVRTYCWEIVQQSADPGVELFYHSPTCLVRGMTERERLDGPGHWMQLDAPDQVNRLLLDQLASEDFIHNGSRAIVWPRKAGPESVDGRLS